MLKTKLLSLSIFTFIVFGLATLSLAPYVIASDNSRNNISNEKVYICHATSSETNPFVLIWVSIKSIFNNKGHNTNHHTNDVYNVSSTENCQKVAVTPTPTATPTVTPTPSGSATPTPTPVSSTEPSTSPTPKGEVLGTGGGKDPVVIGSVESNITNLPNTGLPVAGLALIALAPLGFKLRRSNKSETKASFSALNVWEDRQLTK